MHRVRRDGEPRVPPSSARASKWYRGSIDRPTLFLQLIVTQLRQHFHGLAVHPLHELHNTVPAFCEFAPTSSITVAPTARAFRKDVSLGCGDVSGKVAKSKLAFRRTPLDLIGWNTSNNPHGALTDFAEVIEKRLDGADFHGNHGTALA